MLLVGWGYDHLTKTKYWIVRNSYGKSWGNKGDLLIRKGLNDFGIEADIVSFDVALCSPESTTECVAI